MVDCKVNKELEVGDHIGFFLRESELFDGCIKEKTPMGGGDISFLIETDNGACRVKHRYLDLYCKY